MTDSCTKKTIPFLDLKKINTSIEASLLGCMQRVLRSGTYILGDEVEQFESRFASYCKVKHCIGVSNGLEALTLALRALEIGAAHEVIVPSNTFIATWLAVSEVGAKIVPVEPDAFTYNLNTELVTSAITERTRAIIPVHLYGQTANIPELKRIIAGKNIRIIEDAAQAHGATCMGRPAGALGDAAAFSFYPGKNLGAIGDAGAVTTDDDAIADRIRVLRNYGSKEKYVHLVKGMNSRLDPLQAAILSEKLEVLDNWNHRRQAIAAIYNESFRNLSSLSLPVSLKDYEHVWHLYVVRHPLRDDLRQQLSARGIQTLIHYPIPPHLQQAYSDSSWPSLPVAERLANEVLSLPMGPHLSEEDVAYVVKHVREAVEALVPAKAIGTSVSSGARS